MLGVTKRWHRSDRFLSMQTISVHGANDYRFTDVQCLRLIFSLRMLIWTPFVQICCGECLACWMGMIYYIVEKHADCGSIP